MGDSRPINGHQLDGEGAPIRRQSDECESVDAENPLIVQARHGSREALGELFGLCQNYLLLVANLAVKKGLQPKIGASDLVQETFAQAQQIFDRFHGSSEEELRQWLTCILQHKVGNVQKSYFGTARRDVTRERELKSLSDSGEGSSVLATEKGESPSQLLLSFEDQDSLRQALTMLPADYQTVIRLRVEQELEFAEVGRRMDRSEAAVQKLYLRAVIALKSLMTKQHVYKPRSD